MTVNLECFVENFLKENVNKENFRLVVDELLNTQIKEFKEYIETVDDDIFLEACESFEKDYGKGSLKELNECIDNKNYYYRTIFLMSGFLNYIYKVAREKIERMIFKYCPEYKEFIKNNSSIINKI